MRPHGVKQHNDGLGDRTVVALDVKLPQEGESVDDIARSLALLPCLLKKIAHGPQLQFRWLYACSLPFATCGGNSSARLKAF